MAPQCCVIRTFPVLLILNNKGRVRGIQVLGPITKEHAYELNFGALKMRSVNPSDRAV